MMKGFVYFLVLMSFSTIGFAQVTDKGAIGLIIGNVIDDANGKGLQGVTISLQRHSDSAIKKSIITDKNGGFEMDKIPFGLYRLQFSFVGYAPLQIDSINLRNERFDFNLGDIKLKPSNSALQEVVVYAEKPLLENKDGKITFNAGESALSAGASATELLKTMPLISNDANGKILLKGKEPKILIDDKPTDLNAQQLQDLLESLPGSSIEKIELMSNPPPQYATETGGVINIVTRKGKVGLTGRINISVGTRGEGNINTNISYRNKKFSLNVTAGAAGSRLYGGGNSYRTNFFTDSTNFFSTINHFLAKNIRPNFRAAVDYELDKRQLINAVVQFSGNYYDNENSTEYTNINRYQQPYRISNRITGSSGNSINPSINISYNYKGKDVRENLKLFASYSFGSSGNSRNYFQQFMTGDKLPTGIDSTQTQINANNSNAYIFRVDYNKPVKWMNSIFSTGASVSKNINNNLLETFFLKKPDSVFVMNPILSNDFSFSQTITTARVGITIDLKKQWKLTTGTQWEYTRFAFDFTKVTDDANDYASILPNFTVRKDWNREYNLAIIYRKTIRRPGTGELNPSVDYTDPYNLRFGNPTLEPQFAHNFDLNAGKTKGKFYISASLGYNYVTNIIQSIRTLQPDGKTFITYKNITDRQEYEASVFGGYTFSKVLRMNASAGYTFNQYSKYDREVNKYRNGATFYTSINYNIVVNDRLSFDGVIRYNSFADPQGRSRSNINQTMGVQVKFMNKRLTCNLSAVDVFSQQQYTTTTQGSNFLLQSESKARTKNLRFAVAYNLNKNRTKVSSKQSNELYKRLNKTGM